MACGIGGAMEALDVEPPPGTHAAFGDKGLGRVGLGKIGLGSAGRPGAPALVHPMVTSMLGGQSCPRPSPPLPWGPPNCWRSEGEAPFGKGSGLGMPSVLIIHELDTGEGKEALAWTCASPTMVSPSIFPMVAALLCGAKDVPLAGLDPCAVPGHAPGPEIGPAPGVAGKAPSPAGQEPSEGKLGPGLGWNCPTLVLPMWKLGKPGIGGELADGIKKPLMPGSDMPARLGMLPMPGSGKPGMIADKPAEPVMPANCWWFGKG